MTAFDPRLEIGRQMTEIFRRRKGISREDSLAMAREMLQAVNLDDTERILGSIPARLSGGMLQRVAIAVLLGLKPRLVLADEPTSALDKENRKLVLELMEKNFRCRCPDDLA